MSGKSNKAAFITHADADQFVQLQRQKRNWMRHSVALLVLSPRGDQLALVLPKKAVGNDASNVRVPPQLTLQPSSTVKMTGAILLRQLLVRPPSMTELQYLGTGRGNAHRGEDVAVQYGKWIHWVGIQLKQSGRGLFRDDSELFKMSHWCSANHLLAMDTFAMSDRKYVLTLQALTKFSVLGADGKLIAKAGKRLKLVS